MPNIVVIGASAGGLEALRKILSGLPADLQAAIFVVMHRPPDAPSVLPEILSRTTPFEVANAQDGENIRPRKVYLAPPDVHMLIEPGRVVLTNGPKENHHRPAIDPLFRTAARTYGKNVIGVILTGMLDDGALGLQ